MAAEHQQGHLDASDHRYAENRLKDGLGEHRLDRPRTGASLYFVYWHARSSDCSAVQCSAAVVVLRQAQKSSKLDVAAAVLQGREIPTFIRVVTSNGMLTCCPPAAESSEDSGQNTGSGASDRGCTS